MPSELAFQWGPPEHTRSITYGDLEILLLCVVPHEAPVTFHKIYTFENALRILSTGPTTIPGVYGGANPAHLKSTLESIRSDPAFKEFDVGWDTVERQQKAAGIFRKRLRELERYGILQMGDDYLEDCGRHASLLPSFGTRGQPRVGEVGEDALGSTRIPEEQKGILRQFERVTAWRVSIVVKRSLTLIRRIGVSVCESGPMVLGLGVFHLSEVLMQFCWEH